MTEESNGINHKSFFYPPGGILLWIIVLVEVATFLMGIGSFLYERKNLLEEFRSSQEQLSIPFAMMNTFFLVTSGFAIALGVSFFEKKDFKKYKILLLTAILFGVFFLGLKGYEYLNKINTGFTLDAGSFWAYYWFLTGFHYFHVVAGLVILIIVYFNKESISLENLEAGATFWHMCDLIWVILLPVLYLIR